MIGLRRPRPASQTVPTISVVVVVYDMPRQAMNTLYTLSREYQRDIADVEYEVVVVENLSKHNLKRRAVERLGPEFRYLPRQESGTSPVWALREGINAARGDVIGLMVDGARMVTPGVLRNVADAFTAFPDALVATAGFHLGDADHLNHAAQAARTERDLLKSIPWREDGYVLFANSVHGGGNPYGYLHPLMESNAMFATRSAITAMGGPHVRFDQVGGGALNPDLFRELAELPQTQLVILPGEASFHQFHGGVTTSQDDQREDKLASFRDRYVEIRGSEFHSPLREPMLFGTVDPRALEFLHYSAVQGRDRFAAMMRRLPPEPAWQDEPVVIDPHLLANPTGAPVQPPQEGDDVSIYLPDSIRHFYPRHIVFSTWIDHIQFGYDLVAATKPRRLVELGTQAHRLRRHDGPWRVGLVDGADFGRDVFEAECGESAEQARCQRAAFRFDHARVGGDDGLADLRDLAVAHQHVGVVERADGVDGMHACAADQHGLGEGLGTQRAAECENDCTTDHGVTSFCMPSMASAWCQVLRSLRSKRNAPSMNTSSALA